MCDLRLSDTELKFEYETHNTKMYALRTLTLFNDNNSDVKFKFKVASKKSLFTMIPNESIVAKGKSIDIEFKYLPTGKKLGKSDFEDVELVIDNGDSKHITLEGIT